MLSGLVINALVCSEQLIARVQTEFLAEQSLDCLLHTLRMIERRLRAPLSHLLVPTMVDRRNRASAVTLAAMRRRRDVTHGTSTFPPTHSSARQAVRVSPWPCGSPMRAASRCWPSP